MDIHAGLVDQRVQQIRADHRAVLVGDDAKLQNDEPKLTSRAFTALCVSTLLDLPLDEACGKLTDASHDLAIDALHVEGLRDGEFGVVLFQAKYRQKFDGASSFPANDVVKVLQTVATLFDPNKRYDERTPLAARVEEIRSLIREGFLPTVRVVLCNNGQPWTGDAQAHIDAAGLPDDQVTFEHLGPARIVSLLRAPKPVDDTLRLKGKALVEDFDFRRVLVGKMAVAEVAGLFERHGERLLERNIRRYLGLGSNRVNQAIARTLRDPRQRGDFYFFNNGITLTCAKFRHNALQGDDHQVRVEDLQVINGGQTCVTIQRVLAGLDPADFDRAFVIVRLYELEDDDHEIVRAITYATNSQNPVDLRDLRSNDEVQQQLAMGLQALGYTYQRKRSAPGG
ncbi:MAG: AIPR family protein, partial [Myxococcales bacterium]|nr:AIPR family protein [Myxococcales bacterium]